MTQTYLPFSGVKHDVSDCRTVDEVLESIDANYEVHYRPVAMVENGPEGPQLGTTVAGFKAPYREDTGHALGLYFDRGEWLGQGAVVGQNFGTVQNRRNAELAQVFVDQRLATWKTAASTYNGLETLFELELTDGHFALDADTPEPDEYRARMVMFNSHGGNRSWMGMVLTERLFCWNQLPSVKKQGRFFKYRHSSRVDQKFNQAREIFSRSIRSIQEDKSVFELLASTQMPTGKFVEFASLLLTGKDDMDSAKKVLDEAEGRSRTLLENKFNTLYQLFQSGRGNAGKDARHALNAVSEWTDHCRGSKADEEEYLAGLRSAGHERSLRTNLGLQQAETVIEESQGAVSRSQIQREERRLYSSLVGSGSEMKDRARSLLVKMAS